MNQFPCRILKLVQNTLALAAAAVGCFVLLRGFSLIASGYQQAGAINEVEGATATKLLADARVSLFLLASSTARVMIIIQTFYR
jgi:hypothetical protein